MLTILTVSAIVVAAETGPQEMAARLVNASQKNTSTLPVMASSPQLSDAQKADWSKTVDAYSNTKNEVNKMLGGILYNVTKVAGSLANNANDELRTYISTRQSEKKQQEILIKFYEQYNYLIRQFSLSYEEQFNIKRRVEDIYMEQAGVETPEIDLINFRDMYNVIRKAYGDMTRESLNTGTTNTYYLTGELHSVWQYQNYVPHGTVIYYDKRGEILAIDSYREGYRTNRKKYDSEGKLSFSQDYPHPFDNLTTVEPKENPQSVTTLAPIQEELTSSENQNQIV